jgi:DNA repair exonuclease SbcCD ATPase subunit
VTKKLRIRAPRGWIAYPGSTVQQNYAEDLVHGFLLWDIKDRNHFDVSFKELPNPRPFITIEWQGSIEATVNEARKYPLGARFRIRTKDILTQNEILQLTSIFRSELKAAEVTFKSDHQVNRDVIITGTTIMVKEDLRNPDVLFRLMREYYSNNNITEEEWLAVKKQVGVYLAHVLSADDVVRNTKWSLRYLQFDNTFAYGEGNVLNFDQMNGIVGIFGPNRIGKSSIIGSMMYALFNTTDRGNVKNLYVVNVRRPYCYTKAIVNVNGTNYVIERQTVKHESRRGRGQAYAGTSLNIFKINANGDAEDMAGEQRNDTEKVIRKLIGTADDCLLTSIATQDDVKLFINQGTSKRLKDLSRFLDIDIFDKMFDRAKIDVNVNKNMLKNLPDRDWTSLIEDLLKKIRDKELLIEEKDQQREDAILRLQELRTQLSAFKDFNPVTKSQVDQQRTWVASMEDANSKMRQEIEAIDAQIAEKVDKIAKVDDALMGSDLDELRKRLETYRTLESSFMNLKVLYDKDIAILKQQERSLKILDDVPCGNLFPGCKFIKDAFKQKDKVEFQREKVKCALERLEKAQIALEELKKEDLPSKVSKLEKLKTLRATLQNDIDRLKVIKDRKEYDLSVAMPKLENAKRRLIELEEALKNEENVEVVALRNALDEVQQIIKRIDGEKLMLASEVGRITSDLLKLEDERKRRQELLQLMKAHELIAQAFSRHGIPSLIIASQLPLINAEVAKILNGIVNFTVELAHDDDSDSMEIYLDYGDSKRVIELGSGMEKTIASIAIRVALINISALPKTDMFIIDESFGALDPAGVEACNRLLISLKRYFKTIIVITHVEGVKDVADHIIEVQKVEKDAKVMYNDSWFSKHSVNGD